MLALIVLIWLKLHGSLMSEQELHLQVAQYLNVALPTQTVWHHSPNEGKHKPYYRKLQIKKGMHTGWPDIEIIYRGRFIGIELKTEKGRVSKAQKACHDKITLSGGLVKICRSLDEVTEFVEMAIGK
jgi:hypothetical protein